MNFDQLSKLLFKHFDHYEFMVRSHPKAARKARVRSKWKKRFGPGFSAMLRESNSIYSKLKERLDVYDLPLHL